MRTAFLFRLALLAPLVLAACEDSDLFADKKTPLSGTRRELFPSGAVPGVDYAQPPIQPNNSNIPVNTEVPKNLLTDEPPAPPPPPAAAQEPKSRTARQAPRGADPDDPWAGARTPD